MSWPQVLTTATPCAQSWTNNRARANPNHAEAGPAMGHVITPSFACSSTATTM